MRRQGWGAGGVISLLAGLALGGCGEQEASTSMAEPPEGVSAAAIADEVRYRLEVSPEVRDGEWVTMTLASNIPGEIEVMTSVRLAGQGPTDMAVGTSQRVPLRNGQGEAVMQMSELPQGDYEVMATFYPRWGFGEGRKVSAIDARIDSDVHLVAISGSGEPAEEYVWRKGAQNWVMTNVVGGERWTPDSWQRRFGPWEEFPATKRNPRIIKNYYFPRLEMTVTVNVLKQEVATWGMGRAGL